MAVEVYWIEGEHKYDVYIYDKPDGGDTARVLVEESVERNLVSPYTQDRDNQSDVSFDDLKNDDGLYGYIVRYKEEQGLIDVGISVTFKTITQDEAERLDHSNQRIQIIVL